MGIPVIIILLVSGLVSSVLGRETGLRFARNMLEAFSMIPDTSKMVELGTISAPDGPIRAFFGNRSLAASLDRVVIATSPEGLAHEVGHFLAPHGFNFSAGPIPCEIAAWIAAQQLAAADGGEGVDAMACASALCSYTGSPALAVAITSSITGKMVNPLKVKAALKEVMEIEGLDKAAVKAVMAPLVEALGLLRDGEALMPGALELAHEAHMIAEDILFDLEQVGLVETGKLAVGINAELLDGAICQESGEMLEKLQSALDKCRAGIKFARFFA